MNLLSVTLQPATSISVAICGNFTGAKTQEIVVAKGNALELFGFDEQGRIQVICSTPAFAVIRSLIAFRIAGSSKDYVVIGSDAGKISIVEYDVTLRNWKLVHAEVYGRTGCRRAVPGQYLAADPKGRALMIASVEKQKLVYIMNRDLSNKLTISSPLEAHKAETILFSVVGLDVDFENPIFAMIELEYTEADQDPSGEAVQEVEKKLAYYELDLGLNHVIRKWSEPISRTANILLSVPGGTAGPSGVLICGENWISYKHQGHVEVRAPLPRRHDLPVERGTLITCGAMFKSKDTFFYLVQSEYGDLYKVSLEWEQNQQDGRMTVQDIVISVFDTIQPANAMCITRKGMLFVGSEFSNHTVYQIQGIDDADAVKSRKIADESLNESLGDDAASAARVAPVFTASERLQNLEIAEQLTSLAPCMDMIVADVHGEDNAQILALCGRGNRSSLRTLRQGVSVQELARLDFPEKPTGVWALKQTPEDILDRFIVVSFPSKTLVFSVGETLEETADSGLESLSSTLTVALLADNSYIQVHTQGFRHVSADGRRSDWRVPAKRFVQHASVNSRQLALVYGGRQLVYFELNAIGQMAEMNTIELSHEIACLDVGVISAGRARSMFLAVGGYNNTVELRSLELTSLLNLVTEYPVDGRPTAVNLAEMIRDVDLQREDNNSSSANSGNHDIALYLHIGLESGVLHRVAVDAHSGDLSDPREKFLGPRAIKLFRVGVGAAVAAPIARPGQPTVPVQQTAVVALANRAWLCYQLPPGQQGGGRYQQDPVIYDSLEHITDFSYADNPQGLAAIAGRSLRLLSVEHLGQRFHETVLPLRYTPRRFVHWPASRDVVVIESDPNEYSEAQKQQLRQSNAGQTAAAAAAMETEDEDTASTTVLIRGPVPAAEHTWASCVRILHLPTQTTKCLLELSDNEAAFSVTHVVFRQHSEERFLIVGTAQDLRQLPKKSFRACYLHVYRLLDDGNMLQLLHKTEVEDIPFAMVEFQGRLLVGIGRHLRLYDMGKRKLLKKCENKALPTAIVRLQVKGDRIFVGDISQSVILVRYRPAENTLGIIADDTLPRFITCMSMVDYHTVMCGDKFGNLFVLRLPSSANEDLQITGTGTGTQADSSVLWEQGLLSGAPNKVELLAQYYLGEMATAIAPCELKYSPGRTVLLVSTITGGLHAVMPLQTKNEAQVFQQLEMFLRQEYQTISQRDHMSYRSFYMPVKNVIDVSLCERYLTMPRAKQRAFAEGLDRTPVEIVKKLEEIGDVVLAESGTQAFGGR